MWHRNLEPWILDLGSWFHIIRYFLHTVFRIEERIHGSKLALSPVLQVLQDNNLLPAIDSMPTHVCSSLL